MESIEKFKQGLQSLVQDSSADSNPFKASGLSSSPEQAQILVRRASGRVVSLWACSKLCAVSFVVGVVFGFTLKTRLRRWASKLLKRLKDD